jgi:ketosteroid isomerase-like protein
MQNRLLKTLSFVIAVSVSASAVVLPICPPVRAEAMSNSLKLSEADTAAIKETFKRSTEALVAGDWNVWSEFWAKDAVLMPPSHPSITGIEKLRKFVQADLSNLKDFKQSDWTFEGQGNLAVVTTGMEWTFKEGKSKKGKQIVIMVKDAEGAWRAQKVIYNLDGSS